MVEEVQQGNGSNRSFRDLLVWQQAMDLAVAAFELAEMLPKEHRFELGRELRRSSTSVSSNIAEGFCRHSRNAYRAHIAIALGSTAELETQIEIGIRTAALPRDSSRRVIDRANHVGRLLQGLWRSLNAVR